MSDSLLRDKSVAKKFDIGVSTVWLYVKKGLLPAPHKFGCTTVWKESELDAIINKLGAV